MYYSFTTLTTLGYGDIVPKNYKVMMFSNLEAIIGQMYSAIVLARLVGLYTAEEMSKTDD
ncbi:potassium channel family protein [Limnoraphis robusta Tam1]|uniref:Potassium channel family protein n=1 Tax=Limnoraphis robusta CCNP1315 TaxID=3110306 RepID=A0ABU5TT27_9CYAN|nr:potassium channel family protein [Limnoraphis robusta]MEA5499040.1 potassium channel family protein [Limnoraphis robusta BA-68 BA1]MEA5518049.1 potassium channel family protein [Limnoraphis robusta CCNP1315]MEA5539357.1 potassium channel family protein [Limnoraphis robusta Tam1]MEA5547832.1 potassium channel family protein [Limnoraphis robusta CCNP1324]